MIGLIDQVSCPTLFHFGNEDAYIPSDDIDTIGAALAGHPGFVLNVENAGHAFDNHDSEMFYNESAATCRMGQDHGVPGGQPAGVRALVRAPGPRLTEGLLTHLERTDVDVEVATRQWHGYVEALKVNGWEIVEVPPADDCPDAVFVEDTIVMFGDLAVISLPGARSRQPETAAVDDTITALGYHIAAHPTSGHT